MKPELLESLIGNIQKSHKYARTKYLRAEAGEMGIELAKFIIQHGITSAYATSNISSMAQAIMDKMEGK